MPTAKDSPKAVEAGDSSPLPEKPGVTALGSLQKTRASTSQNANICAQPIRMQHFLTHRMDPKFPQNGNSFSQNRLYSSQKWSYFLRTFHRTGIANCHHLPGSSQNDGCRYRPRCITRMNYALMHPEGGNVEEKQTYDHKYK